MDDNDIDDIDVESIILRARNGDQEALAFLIVCRWMMKVLNTVSGWASKKYKVDRDDVKQIVWISVYYKIQTLKNLRETSWSSCLRSWCYSIARNFCLNERRHDNVVSGNNEPCQPEDTSEICAPTKGNRRSESNAVQMSPEDILILKERTRRQKQIIWTTISSFRPRKKLIALLFFRDQKSVREIIAETQLPASTVYRNLKQAQKTIKKKIAEAEAVENYHVSLAS